MKKIFTLLLFLTSAFSGYSQGVNLFTLPDVVSGNDFSLSQHSSATAVVLIFTSNTCPFSKLYTSRISDLANQYKGNNMKFVLINPNAGHGEGESVAEMVTESNSAMGGLPYLSDANQSVANNLGISKLPEVVVIVPGTGGFTIAYQGGIDNNPQLPQSATKKYLEDALNSISQNQNPDPAYTRPVGCNLKSSP